MRKKHCWPAPSTAFPARSRTRAAIPVLEGIYMKAEGFNLTLTGYDMEMGITTTIECNVLVPGETVLDAKLLSAMVNRMPGGRCLH